MSQENEDLVSTTESSLPIGIDASSVLLTTRNVMTKTVELDIKAKLEACNFDINFADFNKPNSEIQEKQTSDQLLIPSCVHEDDEEFSESSTLFEADSYIKSKWFFILKAIRL